MSKNDFHSVIVYGDTNTTLAGALVGRQLNLNVIHIESGLRNYDKTMPEEINRILTDRISDVLFCVSDSCVDNLKSEGIWYDSVIHKSGDLMYDSVLNFKNKSNEISNSYGDYALVTVHRASNTDNKEVLGKIVDSLNQINRDIKVVFPIHPRTRNKVTDMNVEFDLIEPVGYIEMLSLIDNSKFVITDSGGVVRESYWLEKPSLLLLDKPLWPELVDSGVCLKTNENNIIDNYKLIKNISSFPRGIYGDGDSAKKITKWLCDGF